MLLYFDEKVKNREEKKLNNPNQGKKWTREDDELLIKEYKLGKSIKELSKIFQRSSSSIQSRLLKLIEL